jgi:hypothetical protein
VEDFRGDPMESADGQGIARRAWESYARRTNQALEPAMRSVLGPAAKKLGASAAVDLYGFWLCWHLEGGYEGLRGIGMSRSAIYRRIKVFRTMTGKHPDEFEMPGVTLNLPVYQRARDKERAARARRKSP